MSRRDNQRRMKYYIFNTNQRNVPAQYTVRLEHDLAFQHTYPHETKGIDALVLYETTEGKSRTRKAMCYRVTTGIIRVPFGLARKITAAAKHVPVLTDLDMVYLFFDDNPVSKATTRKRLHDARRTAEEMEDKGYIVIIIGIGLSLQAIGWAKPNSLWAGIPIILS